MKAIHLKETDLIAVVVTADAYGYIITDIRGDNDLVCQIPDKSGFEYLTSLPEGEYDILGTCTKDHIDFDVEPYLEVKDLAYSYPNVLKIYKCYSGAITGDTDKGSAFRSLLTANGIDLELTPKVLILKKLK